MPDLYYRLGRFWFNIRERTETICKMIQLARNSAAMAIFLGKNYLGQKNELGIRNYSSDKSVPLNLENLDGDEVRQLKVLLDKTAKK